MAISTIAGPPPERGIGYFVTETLNPSTSTTAQAIALTVPLTLISTATGGTGTATGFERNVFSLSTASAIEGQVKTVIMTGTGEAKLILTGTATGRWTLTEADDLVMVQMFNRKWRVIQSTATLATATS